MNVITRAHLLADLRLDEGKRPHPYLDSLGHWTVGFGHNLDGGPPLSDRSMAMILDDDLAAAETAATVLPWYAALDDVRQTVIVTMLFNLGLGKFGQFRKMIAACEAGDYPTAAVEMLDSIWATQVGPRAVRLAAQMRTGLRP